MSTLGPWKIYDGIDAHDQLESGWVLIVARSNAGNIVANVNVHGGPTYRDKMPAMENAKLIAAAPSIFNALKSAIAALELANKWTSQDNFRQEIDAGKAAIAIVEE